MERPTSVEQWIRERPEVQALANKWQETLVEIARRLTRTPAHDHPSGADTLPSQIEQNSEQAITRRHGKFGFLILSAPSGGGKRTVGSALEDFGFERLARYTTRSLRTEEVEGVDYHHVSREAFLAMDKRGEFFPWVETHGELRAISKKDFQELLTRRALFYVEGSVKAYDSFLQEPLVDAANPLSLFLLPTDFPTLVSRLIGRGDTLEEPELLERIAAGEAHLRKTLSSSYDGYVVNDDALRAAKRIHAHLIRQ